MARVLPKKLRFTEIAISGWNIFGENDVAKLVVDNEPAAIRRCSSKQVFLKISQISQKNICVGVLF